MKIEFKAENNPQKWFNTVAKGFGVEINNNEFEIPASLGKGVWKQFCFFEGFTLTYLHLKLSESLELVRQSVQDAQLFPIMFYCQDAPLEQNIDEQKKLIGYHTANGIFMPSPQIESSWTLPREKDGFQVTLTIDKKWFLESSKHSNETYFGRLLKSKKAFYLFESMLPSMKNVIHTIHEIINSNDKFLDIKLHQKAIELFNLFLENVENRNLKENISGINASDIEKIFQTRQKLLENLTNVPSLKQLSLDAGMSISKLQKCFQQVFGLSISQYALSEKMNLAKQLFDTKKYSVSEVGYKLAYSNLSHFTKAFRNEFGLNPKQYLLDK